VLAYLDSSSGANVAQAIIGLAVAAAIYVVPAFLVARYAANKGHSYGIFLVLGLLVSWLISLLVALAVDDRNRPRQVVMEPGPDDHLDRLKKLTELRDAGTLSSEEFEAEKARILAER
jgi:hypothetical protein